MDSDLVPWNGVDSKYFQILHNRRNDLDFLMPQFYNGVTRPGVDGVGGTGVGAMSAAAMFGTLSNGLFDNEPHKVSFSSTTTAVHWTCDKSRVSTQQSLNFVLTVYPFINLSFSIQGGIRILHL